MRSQTTWTRQLCCCQRHRELIPGPNEPRCSMATWIACGKAEPVVPMVQVPDKTVSFAHHLGTRDRLQAPHPSCPALEVVVVSFNPRLLHLPVLWSTLGRTRANAGGEMGALSVVTTCGTTSVLSTARVRNAVAAIVSLVGLTDTSRTWPSWSLARKAEHHRPAIRREVSSMLQAGPTRCRCGRAASR